MSSPGTGLPGLFPLTRFDRRNFRGIDPEQLTAIKFDVRVPK
jgi:hypothetical protein